MTSTTPVNEVPAAIALRDVTKHFGAVHAVDGVTLSVKRGELFGLIGHNGAGKSTLFKMMLGLLPVSSGEIAIAGASVRGRDFRAARRQIGYLPEHLALYDNLSGIETLRFFAKLKVADLAGCAPLLERLGLAAAARRPVREYSKGMRQRLGFAQALLGAPQVLFLDEPSNGLDPAAIREFYAILHELRDQGVTVLITSHILAELQERVDRLAIMVSGRVQALGSVPELREQQDMPLHILLRLPPSALELLRSCLAAVPGLSLSAVAGQPGQQLVSCPRPAKMAVLAALAPLGDLLLDLQIQEPSLEDVFFGLRTPPPDLPLRVRPPEGGEEARERPFASSGGTHA
ncbi:MAG: ABC transporter ATP-binding protein [Burkholderiaceae bacterium]|nr:ABC transporter ATP-binding protein [Burkholderiaceae bacterium]